MAEVSSSNNYSELTAFGGRYRIMGLNNDVFNTNDLLEAEIQMLDAQIKPTENKKTLLETEVGVWNTFKTKFEGLTSKLEELKNFELNSRIVKYDSEGYFEVTPAANAVEGKYDVSVSKLATSHQIAGERINDIENALGVEDTVKINGKELELTSDMSLRDVVQKINNGGFGVSAAIISNRLVLTSKETGVSNAIEFEDGGNGALKQLGILNDDGEIKNTLSLAENAKYSINGIEGESESNVISNGLDGSQITLKRVSSIPVGFEIKNDSEKVVEKAKEFVSTFNSMIETLNSYTGEGADLQGQTTLLNMRTAVSQITNFVGEDGNRLYQMGIELNKNGQLNVNETKLKEVYAENPDSVRNALFGEKGAANFVKNKTEKYVGAEGLLQKKITGIDENIKKLAKEIQKFDDLYEYKTEALYKKYADFESKMSNLNFQLTYMEAQMEALNGNKD